MHKHDEQTDKSKFAECLVISVVSPAHSTLHFQETAPPTPQQSVSYLPTAPVIRPLQQRLANVSSFELGQITQFAMACTVKQDIAVNAELERDHFRVNKRSSQPILRFIANQEALLSPLSR
jgi:hypothetical protein